MLLVKTFASVPLSQGVQSCTGIQVRGVCVHHVARGEESVFMLAAICTFCMKYAFGMVMLCRQCAMFTWQPSVHGVATS